MSTDRRPMRSSKHLRVQACCLAPIAALAIALPSSSATAQESRTQRLVTQAMLLMPHRSEGGRTFASHCASCHGENAHGDAQSVTPALAGQLTLYLVRELADMAEGNRTVTEMHRVIARKELTSAQKLRNVASHLTSLPPLSSPQTGDGQAIPVGKRVYEAECMQCHGDQGQGNAQSGAPMLQAQHYSYLLMQARQMSISHGYDVGVETLERLEELTLEELAAVGDYLSRLRVDMKSEQVVYLP